MINCSALMDCVGCEKCRLWGKLQVLGLGTALKILFSVDNDNLINQQVCLFHIYWLCSRIMLIFRNDSKCIGHIDDSSLLFFQLQLHRNEVIALANLLNRLSESVKFVHEKGPYTERIMEKKSSSYTSKSSS
ncbi:hypothetical protein B296_00005103 [Ensete ventricosum]|uniref:Uncharacterized protein n=1 Tax=Ensete ventricosum TaxID=4639 RepID=A0A426YY55_ENSVE|nr:hypothetical protein B296_00005103 [Ensete ventricosum]